MATLDQQITARITPPLLYRASDTSLYVMVMLCLRLAEGAALRRSLPISIDLLLCDHKWRNPLPIIRAGLSPVIHYSGSRRRRMTRRARYHCKLARMMDGDVRHASWKTSKAGKQWVRVRVGRGVIIENQAGWRKELSSTIVQCLNREGAVIDCAFHSFVAADAEPGTRAQYSRCALPGSATP